MRCKIPVPLRYNLNKSKPPNLYCYCVFNIIMSEEPSRLPDFQLSFTTLRELSTDLQNRHSPITSYVVFAICFVFLTQELAAVYFGASILGVTSYFFLHYPVPAWLLTFFLHKGVMHFLANVALIGFVGRVVEPTFSKREYLLFLVGTIVLSALGAYAFKAPFTTKPVAAYGASGFGYALAAYSLRLPYRHGDGLLDMWKLRNPSLGTPLADRLACLLGVSAILAVALDLFTGPYMTAEWVNGAHLVGVVVGVIVASLGED